MALGPIPSGQPDLAGFTTFVRNVMGIPTNYLPDDSPYLQHALDYGIETTNPDLASAPSQTTSWSPYMLAVYNLAGHVLIVYAGDQSYPLAALSWSAGTVTGQTAAASQILPGDKLTIAAVSPLAYAGPQNLGYVVVQATPDSTHFQYALAANPGAATLLTGAAAVEQYFTQARKLLKINSFVPGVVTSTSDVSTSAGLLNPDFMRMFTLEDLGLLKTQYGQSYLKIAQKAGPTIWGLT